MELYLRQEQQQREYRRQQLQRLSQRLNRANDRESRARQQDEETRARVKRKLIWFYAILTGLISIIASLTGIFWRKDACYTETEKADVNLRGTGQYYCGSWELIYLKIVPLGLLLLFTVSNMWIQCSNRSISRQII